MSKVNEVLFFALFLSTYSLFSMEDNREFSCKRCCAALTIFGTSCTAATYAIRRMLPSDNSYAISTQLASWEPTANASPFLTM